MVQTRMPDHEVLRAAVDADPSDLSAAELALRQSLGLPPFSALALLSGAGGSEFVAALERQDPSLKIAALNGGDHLVRSATHEQLCDALAAVERPRGRLRVEVDPTKV
jgi:primosomal protein N' (replication factor Y)